jgi:hypothetical protein
MSSRVVSDWNGFGHALRDGTLGDVEFTPEMQEAVKAVLIERLQAFLRNRGRVRPAEERPATELVRDRSRRQTCRKSPADSSGGD